MAEPMEPMEELELEITPPQESGHEKPGRLLRGAPTPPEFEDAMREMLKQMHEDILSKFDLQTELILTALKPSSRSKSRTPTRGSKTDTAVVREVSVAPRQRRSLSFNPTFFHTFDEDEKLRKEAALEESKHHSAHFSSASSSHDKQLNTRCRCLGRLVRSNIFEMFFMCVVVTNCIFIGVEVELNRQPQGNSPVIIQTVQYVYTTLFTLELAFRLGAHGKSFFCSAEWLWNWLDIFIVLTSLWEVTTDAIEGFVGLGNAGDQGNALEGMTGLKAFRVIRITRIAKTVRLLHVFRFILALRMLVTSILSTLKSLVWALVLLLLIVYVFAVLFTQAAEAETSADLDRLYGSLPRTMLSLFMSIAGGISWVELVVPLESLSLAWVLLLLFYICFTYFAVLNVVTAVFCQSAIEGAQNDHAAKVQAVLLDKKNHLDKVRALFSEFGADDGIITFSMFQDKINGQAVKDYFSTLGLDVSDAWSLFKLLDTDGGGAVEVEEFLMGCLRLRGQATAMDVAKLMNDVTWLVKNQGYFQTYVEVELKHLRDDLFGRQSRLEGMSQNESRGSPGSCPGNIGG